MQNIKLPDKKTFDYARELFLDWKLVAFPTETVYWLWANALDKKAVSKIFDLKKRPSNNPLIVHIWHKKDIPNYWIISNPIEKKIIDKLMPWPLTILLRKKDNIPNIVSNNPYVWIRIPSNQVALDLLKACGLAIAAPSANISTKPSPTSAKMVYDYFWNNIPLIIDWWNCNVWIESTVIKVDEENKCIPMTDWDCIKSYHITILRPWFITREDLQKLFENSPNVYVQYSTKLTNISPGNMYKHYAPRAQIKIIETLSQEIMKNALWQKISWTVHIKIWLILTEEFINSNKKILHEFKNNIHVFPRWSQSDLITCAQKLFDIYDKCDKLDINYIMIESLPEIWLWYSIMNRVKKSAEK